MFTKSFPYPIGNRVKVEELFFWKAFSFIEIRFKVTTIAKIFCVPNLSSCRRKLKKVNVHLANLIMKKGELIQLLEKQRKGGNDSGNI